MTNKTTIGERMKRYELIIADLPPNTPLVLRLDGRAFHTFTRGMEKPFDRRFMDMMDIVALALVEEIQNTCLAYVQSDEISILIYDKVDSGNWFGNDVQKMTSVSASLGSATAMLWNQRFKLKPERPIMFDSRVFPLPMKEVNNYFIWRQMDWERNSLQMIARSLYSQKQLYKKNKADMNEMLFQKGVNWDSLATRLKRGRCAVQVPTQIEVDNKHFKGEVTRNKWSIDNEIPIFTKDRTYVQEKLEESE